MNLLSAIFAALTPTLLYTLLIWWLDRYEKEPLPLLLAAFGWGSLPAILLAFAFQFFLALPVSSTPLGPNATAWGLAPLVEEPVKAAALVALFLFARRDFDGPLDGIVYGALIGFGFSMTENLLFFLKDPQQLAAQFWLRSVLFGFNHAFFTSIVGLALGSVRYAQQRWLGYVALAASLVVAIVFHAVHNVAVSYQFAGLFLSWMVQSSGVLAVLAVALLAWRHERQWIETQLGEEIDLDTISADDYHEVLDLGLRLRAQFTAVVSADWQQLRLVRRLHQTIIKLAFCKHQIGMGDRFHCCDDRDNLRREVILLRQQRHNRVLPTSY